MLTAYLAERPAVLRNVALVNAAAMLTFVLDVVFYRIFPPAAVMSPSWILYLFAAIFAQRAMRRSGTSS